uniref:Hypothetical plectrovirus spv1 orf 4 n-terminal truncated protein n=1 Tax=Spiroplasma citri TaxID=2133 RepID=Q14MQ6_SPICI|nr:hypothetical plectrovirus spv1 orf 4 n-terminal truncated protein [Spiroplasma citri]
MVFSLYKNIYNLTNWSVEKEEQLINDLEKL